jgi:hypothetical protein
VAIPGPSTSLCHSSFLQPLRMSPLGHCTLPLGQARATLSWRTSAFASEISNGV